MTPMDATAAATRSAHGAPAWDVRPMAVDDVDAVLAVVVEAETVLADEIDPPRTPPSDADLRARRLGHARFVERDGPGAWVAVSGERVVGVAESVRREDFWGLSMLFVHPGFQSRGVGRQLLGAALGHGAGTGRRMIQASSDPRALRRYFLAGLAMHPAADVTGTPDRGAIPPSLPGREGGVEDLDLVDDVERRLGRSRAEDVAFLLGDGRCRLDVIDAGARRGWVVWREGRLVMLGATDDATAAQLMWRCIARAGSELRVYGLTAAQQWAFAVAHRARLTVRVSGALFVDGMAVPGPWIPSGWYF